jgi:hypothetical protein
MILLFTSDFSPRYKDDAIMSLCYPAKHVMVFRYRNGLVQKTIRGWKVDKDGNVKIPPFTSRMTALVYAETQGDDFRFFPFRFARMVRCWRRGEIYYFAVELGSYVDYGKDNSDSLAERVRMEIQGLTDRPYPPQPVSTVSAETEASESDSPADDELAPARGLYAHHVPQCDLPVMLCCRTERSDDEAWQSVVGVAQQSSDLQAQLFYRIRGLYRMKKRFFPFLGFTEMPIVPRTLVGESLYCFPVGDPVVMKLDSFHPPHKSQFPPVRLQVRVSSANLVQVSPDAFLVHSRYNEERIVLSCKRVLENSLATVAVVRASDGDTVAPTDQRAHPERSPDRPVVGHALLLAQVTVSRLTICIILAGLVLVPLLIGSDADSLQTIAKFLAPRLPEYSAVLGDAEVASSVAKFMKWLGASITLVIGYVAYRKIPLSK